MNDNEFILRFQHVLKDPQCIKLFQEAMKPVYKDEIDTLNATVISLKTQLSAKDNQVATLNSRVETLENKLDDMEQWTRRGSMRIQGLKDSPSESNDSLDQKILAVCSLIKVEPPLAISDIEVAHRLPLPRALLQKLAQQDADLRGVALGTLPDGSQSTDLLKLIPPEKLPPRNVIVKFASRRVRSRVMAPAIKKKLKTELKDKLKYPHHVYFQDDLTSRKAKLAYLGRKLTQDGKINDSWVFDSKVLIKDLNNRIRQIRSIRDLSIFGIKQDDTPPAIQPGVP